TAAAPLSPYADTAPVSTIATDPAGDGGPVDITEIAGGSDTETLTLQLAFAPSTSTSQVNGYVLLDLDQDPKTGVPATALFGLPTQDVGVDAYAGLFNIHDPTPTVPIYRTDTGSL